MSVGSGGSHAQSKPGGGSQNSSSGSSGKGKRSVSPASIEKRDLMQGSNKMEGQQQHHHPHQQHPGQQTQFVSAGRDQPPGGMAQEPQPVHQPMYEDFKFTWDGKREE